MTNDQLQTSLATASLSEGYEGDNFSAKQKIIVQCLSRFGLRRKILDVGAADGSVLAELAAKHELHAVDGCQPLLDKCLLKGYSSARQVRLDTDLLPYSPEFFDAVVWADCVEHVVDSDHVFQEVHRVLKPHGDLIITFPNVSTPLSIAMLLLADLPPHMGARYRSGHVRDWTNQTMREALRNNGFHPQCSYGVGFAIGPSPWGILPKIARYIPRWSSVVVMHATKQNL